ncbi:RNA dependent RNA polymerase-domain-containing protein [Vararia minispora EC-137]|uniref:RNA dependent RNA polymerase-domain-containing protein n=1 Tax=Vararia minispora EC-137 TaxID=1314806 RepID=A0ACB8QPP8_9AGAM|nr:RNA dependent RNA polymerase-domain-containing protein [Vararia minispora EC-137]
MHYLDEAGIAFGVQYELARGVQLKRWSWDYVTPERVELLKGLHAEVVPKLCEIMGSNRIDPLHSMAAIWEEYDREQAAILEDKGRGLGLVPETFYDFEDWYGGRIQQVIRLEAHSNGPRPYSLHLEPPEMKRSFRIARLVSSRRILVVKTSTKSEKGKKKSQYPPGDILARRFILLGRVYVPFCAKDGHVYMVETNEDFGRTPRVAQGDFSRLSFRDFVRVNNPISLNSSQPISKWVTRFDLGTSTSVPVLEFMPENIFFIDDIVADGCIPGTKVPPEKCMTDGGGFLNGAAATLIAERMHLASRPTAIQGRIAGSKGVWVLHPEDKLITEPPRIWIRASQQKIALSDLAAPDARCHRIFDLVQPSRVTTPARLSMQLILNMSHNGVPDDVFIKLLDASLREETTVFTDWSGPYAMPLLWAAVGRAGNIPAVRLQRLLPTGAARAMGIASRFDMERTADGAAADVFDQSESQTDAPSGRSGPDTLHETVMELIQAGFRPDESSYLHQKLRYVLDLVIQGVVGKYRIPVARSAEAYVIAVDPLGVLEEGEIHFQSTVALGADPFSDDSPYIVTGDVLVKSINHPALAAFTDVIIVPIKGTRSFMSDLSGGDLDGDTAWITWEPSLVESFTNTPLVVPPSTFISGNFERNGERLSDFCERLKNDSDRFAQELVQALLGGMSDRKVGLYSKFHDLACWQLGYDHPDTERLAHMFTTCLDANKTGLRVISDIFRADSRKWDVNNIPSCLQPVKNQYTASTGQYPRRQVPGPFVLESIRSAGVILNDELLGVYENLGPPRVLDADLLVPAMAAYTFAKRMRQEQGFNLWNCELRDLRAFVKECRDGWPGVASPKKGLPADDRDASIKELAVRFDSDAPDLSVFALVDARALRASLAYETCYPGNENFAFAVAFRDLCELKAKARGDAKPIVKELAETLTMGKSTRLALERK